MRTDPTKPVPPVRKTDAPEKARRMEGWRREGREGECACRVS